MCVCVDVRLKFLRWDKAVKVKINVIHRINESQDRVSEYQSYMGLLGCSKMPLLHAGSACMFSLELSFMSFHVFFPESQTNERKQILGLSLQQFNPIRVQSVDGKGALNLTLCS